MGVSSQASPLRRRSLPYNKDVVLDSRDAGGVEEGGNTGGSAETSSAGSASTIGQPTHSKFSNCVHLCLLTASDIPSSPHVVICDFHVGGTVVMAVSAS